MEHAQSSGSTWLRGLYKNPERNSLAVQWLGLSACTATVQSLVGELRSCKPWRGQKKKNPERWAPAPETLAQKVQ